jgi:DNA invertase Pin-like site-specific DNA recombinase
MTTYGYARVSTDGQSLESQVAALTAAGCGKTYREKVSRAKTDRTALGRVLAAPESGDALMVTSITVVVLL